MRVFSRLALAPIAALLVLGACAADDEPSTPSEPASSTAPRPTSTPEPFRGLPEGAANDFQSPAGLVIGQDRLVQVVTYGSSSNPSIVHGVTATGQTVTVDVHNVPGRPATMDFQPTTSAFYLPESVDTTQPITFDLGTFGAATTADFEPGLELWLQPRG